MVSTYSHVKFSSVSDASGQGHDEQDEDNAGQRSEKRDTRVQSI
jgi:hypothetical protein